MSDIDKRLDELMEFDVWCMCGANECVLAQNFKEAKQAIKQLMVDEFEKIIGDMEYRETEDMSLGSWSNEDYKAFGRNELRIELRQKLKEWKK